MTTLALPRNLVSQRQEVYSTFWDPVTRRVTVTTTLTIEQIRASMSEEDWNYANRLARRFQGKRMVIVNSTLRGGGVVIMRKPLIVLLKLLGVDVDWYVLAPNQAAFQVTKWSFHNVMQDVPGAVPLTKAGKAIYLGWIAGEAEALKPALAEADVLIIDDWQPSGLIPYVKMWGFTCKIIVRDHIQTKGSLMVTKGTPQYTTWSFLWGKHGNRICDADIFVTHPREIFVPPNVPKRKVAFMGATVEPLDELLREVTDEEIEQERAWLNHKFSAWGHTPVDWTKRYKIVVARFDESKFMEGALKTHALSTERLLALGVPLEETPALVLVGNGATDDPSGRRMLRKIRRLVRTTYRKYQDRIHVARVPHRDLALNVLLRGAWIALQPSIAEGFESRVTDAIWLGVPVIGSTEGGIPLQILEGLSGFVLNPYHYGAWADLLVELALDEPKYQRLRETTKVAARTHNVRFTTVKNAIGWLSLAILALEEPGYDLDMQWADSLTADSLALAA